MVKRLKLLLRTVRELTARAWETGKSRELGMETVIPIVDCPEFQTSVCCREHVSKQIERTIGRHLFIYLIWFF